jgi:glucose/mannose transport system substrate-binding protein
MFRLKDPQAVQGQKALARTIMSAGFQETFNRNKGSIPVALGANMSSFDYCARESSGYFVAASLANSLVPSFAHKMAQPEAKVAAVQAVVAKIWDDDSYAGPRAQADLAAAAASH